MPIHSFARNAGVLLLGHLGVLILSIGTGVCLARGLGPEGRGAYLAVVLWPQILGWQASLGLAKATAYQRARRPELAGKLAANGILVSLAAGAVVVLGAEVALSLLLRQYSKDVIWIGRSLLLLVPVFALGDILQGLLQGAARFRMLAVSRICAPLIQLVGFLVLLLSGVMDVGPAALVFGFSTVATLVLQLSLLRVESGSLARPDRTVLIETGRYALTLYPAFLADVAIMSLDQILLIPMLAASDLGYYAVATRAMLLAQAPVAASQILFATVAAMPVARGMALAGRVLLVTMSVTAVLGIAAWLLADVLIGLLFGTAFIAAVAPFRVLLLGAFAMGASRIVGETLSGLGKPQYVSVSQVVTLGAMAVLLWMLVPRWQISGAAWAVTLAQLVNLAVIGVSLVWVRVRSPIGTAG